MGYLDLGTRAPTSRAGFDLDLGARAFDAAPLNHPPPNPAHEPASNAPPAATSTAPESVRAFEGEAITPTRRKVSTASVLSSAGSDLFYGHGTIMPGKSFKPQDLDGYRRTARNGYPKELYATYDEMPRLGPGSQIKKRTNGVASAKVEFLAWPPEARDPDAADQDGEAKLARDVADYFNREWKPWMPRILRAAAKAALYGIAAVQITVDPEGDGAGRERILQVDAVPARRFRLDRDTLEWLFMPDPLRPEGVSIKPLRERGQLLWFEVDTEQPVDQKGLLWQCLAFWCLEQMSFRWGAKRLELFGIPPRWAFYDPQDPDTLAAVNAALKNMGAAMYGAFPIGTKIEVGDAGASAAEKNLHNDSQDHLQRGYDKILLGHAQASAVQSGAGSQQSADNAQEEFFRILDGELEYLSWTLRADIRRAVARNFTDPRALSHIPECSLVTRRNENLVQQADIVLKLSQAGGARFMDPHDVFKPFGIPVAKPNVETMAAPVPEALPGQEGAVGKKKGAGKGANAGAPGAAAGAKAGAKEAQMSRLASALVFGTASDGPPEPPDIPRGFGEDLVGPYRDILLEARREGKSLPQALGRILTRMREDVSAAEMTEILAAVLLDATMQGVIEADEARGESAAA